MLEAGKALANVLERGYLLDQDDLTKSHFARLGVRRVSGRYRHDFARVFPRKRR